MALYTTWRPLVFKDVIGQEHIVTTLQNAIANNRVSHAYLFSGPHGTGKTTVARIFAKAVSCTGKNKPCYKCDACTRSEFDIIEIDAASNSGVDNIRDLRQQVNFAPTAGAYKVYIVDECHMLSTSAFNALLKTLEEPPRHVIFILCTTEISKLPATIISRCQPFEFHLIGFKNLRDHLTLIAKGEEYPIERSALDLITRRANGSMRDGISLLDQLITNGGVTYQQTLSLLGSAKDVNRLIDCILTHNVSVGMSLINQTIRDGADPRQFVRDILEYLRNMLLMSIDSSLVELPVEQINMLKNQRVPTDQIVSAIQCFSEASNPLSVQLAIEVAFLESMRSVSKQSTNEF